ncbi:nucleoside triphosphate pyrophosphohydrolase family protein [Patescibacteria group bacterium]|nr:nucleoside triphosphate pyrophosphohydrolase family protein [Patescibacteria group bacterium]
MSRDQYKDVRECHEHFGLVLNGPRPRRLSKRKMLERIQFLQEELDELVTATGLKGKGSAQDFAGQADALVDLVYVALGTAAMMGLPWGALWDDVHRANMSKVRGITHRGHKVDLAKPAGWVGPHTDEILTLAGYDAEEGEVDDDEA